jgi:prophage DNA circulation protein
MSKYNNSSSNNNSGFSYSVNNQNNNHQDFTDSINRSLDQTKENINRSIDESKKQIPRFNDIVNNYQEQALQTTKDISENYIESQKSIIHSLQSAWGPYQQNINTTVNSWNSPEAVANAYSRFVSNVADNSVSALRTTNNMMFSCLDAHRSTLQHAKDNSKQIFNLNSNAAKTFEQNSRELTRAAQDTVSQNNASYNSRGGDNASTSFTTSTPTGTTSTTTSSKSTA